MNRRRGFSLLEIVVAFAIASLAFGAIFRIVGTSARQAAIARHQVEALSVAQGRLAEAGIAVPLAEGSEVGDTRERYAWRRSVTLYEQGDAHSDLARYRVTVEVHWEDGGRRSVSLSTVRVARSGEA